MSVYEDIARYEPFNEQEMRDKDVILRFLEENDDAFLRDVQKLLVARNEGNQRHRADNSENDILFHGCHHIRRKH